MEVGWGAERRWALSGAGQRAERGRELSGADWGAERSGALSGLGRGAEREGAGRASREGRLVGGSIYIGIDRQVRMLSGRAPPSPIVKPYMIPAYPPRCGELIACPLPPAATPFMLAIRPSLPCPAHLLYVTLSRHFLRLRQSYRRHPHVLDVRITPTHIVYVHTSTPSGWGNLIAATLMYWTFGVCGQRLAFRLRMMLYRSILHMEVSVDCLGGRCEGSVGGFDGGSTREFQPDFDPLLAVACALCRSSSCVPVPFRCLPRSCPTVCPAVCPAVRPFPLFDRPLGPSYPYISAFTPLPSGRRIR